ncbi:MAG: hypothetical protein ABSD49_14370 [Candidatus Bathyarchaeia archaeon]|jgi:hypothetical protein
MPLLSGVYGELLTTALVLGYGILWEKYYVAKPSVVVNLAGFIVVLVTTDLPTPMYWFLGAYVFFTFVGMLVNARPLFILVGSKTYGALTLTIGLQELGYLGSLSQYLANNLGPTYASGTWLILVEWFLIAIGVHIIGAIYTLATKKRYKRKR